MYHQLETIPGGGLLILLQSRPKTTDLVAPWWSLWQPFRDRMVGKQDQRQLFLLTFPIRTARSSPLPRRPRTMGPTRPLSRQPPNPARIPHKQLMIGTSGNGFWTGNGGPSTQENGNGYGNQRRKEPPKKNARGINLERGTMPRQSLTVN